MYHCDIYCTYIVDIFNYFIFLCICFSTAPRPLLLLPFLSRLASESPLLLQPVTSRMLHPRPYNMISYGASLLLHMPRKKCVRYVPEFIDWVKFWSLFFSKYILANVNPPTHGQVAGGSPVEALQPHSNTQPHWSSGSTVCFRPRGAAVCVRKSPRSNY